MRIVMRTFSSDPHYNGEAENAYVFLDERLAKVIAGRFNLFELCKKSNPDIVEIHFLTSDVECGFYNFLGFHDDAVGFLPGKEAEDHYDEHGWCEIPEDSAFKGDLSRDSFDEVFGVRADGTYMVVCENGVYWELHPKHTDGLTVLSEVLPRDIVAKVI